ncbi:MAG: c-type cytochrome [Wenzhouxiangellaceae bacterium]|nr:c-type cytochrome [Wenzhouxiangellaceae bacterium]
MIDFLVEHDGVDKCVLIGSMSEDQRMQLAAYFASLPHEPFEQDIDPARVAAGEALHQARCERCHTENGTEPLDDAAILAGQSIGYLERQLINFRSGDRWQPRMMSRQTDDLSEDEILSLAHFYASVRR